MRLIRRGAIQDYGGRHPDALKPLLLWANAVEGMVWKSPDDVRLAFRSVEFKGPLTVFDLGESKHRVVAMVHYVRDIVFLAISGVPIYLDTKLYRRQLSKTLPASIETDDENNRLLAVIEELMEKREDELTAEEDAFLDEIVELAYTFEEINHQLPSIPPHETIAFLLEQRGLTATDLRPVLGSESRVAETLSGTATLSRDETKTLATFLRVGAWVLTPE